MSGGRRLTGGKAVREAAGLMQIVAGGDLASQQDVCPSHAGILSKRLYISSKFFSPLGRTRPTTVVFPNQTGWQYSDGTPLTGPPNAWGMKKSRFSTNISLYLGNDAR